MFVGILLKFSSKCLFIPEMKSYPLMLLGNCQEPLWYACSPLPSSFWFKEEGEMLCQDGGFCNVLTVVLDVATVPACLLEL